MRERRCPWRRLPGRPPSGGPSREERNKCLIHPPRSARVKTRSRRVTESTPPLTCADAGGRLSGRRGGGPPRAAATRRRRTGSAARCPGGEPVPRRGAGGYPRFRAGRGQPGPAGGGEQRESAGDVVHVGAAAVEVVPGR